MSIRSESPRPIDALKISPAERREVLELLARREAGDAGRARRDKKRLFFANCPTGLVVIDREDGAEALYAVLIRDISESGIGFVHGGFVHPGTTFQVALRKVDGAGQSLRGRVARCIHIKGRAHLIGGTFLEPIAIEQFVGVSESAPAAPEAEAA